MANIFQNLPTQSGNNPLQMLSEFKRFASMTNPQNAKAEVERLLQSGQMSQQQFESIKQQAQNFMKILK